MEPEFDTERFEKKLLNLKDTQDSITGLSKWCLKQRLAHKQIVKCWLNVLKQGESSRFIFQIEFREKNLYCSENREPLDTLLPRERCYSTQQTKELRVR